MSIERGPITITSAPARSGGGIRMASTPTFATRSFSEPPRSFSLSKGGEAKVASIAPRPTTPLFSPERSNKIASTVQSPLRKNVLNLSMSPDAYTIKVETGKGRKEAALEKNEQVKKTPHIHLDRPTQGVFTNQKNGAKASERNVQQNKAVFRIGDPAPFQVQMNQAGNKKEAVVVHQQPEGQKQKYLRISGRDAQKPAAPSVEPQKLVEYKATGQVSPDKKIAAPFSSEEWKTIAKASREKVSPVQQRVPEPTVTRELPPVRVPEKPAVVPQQPSTAPSIVGVETPQVHTKTPFARFQEKVAKQHLVQPSSPKKETTSVIPAAMLDKKTETSTPRVSEKKVLTPFARLQQKEAVKQALQQRKVEIAQVIQPAQMIAQEGLLKPGRSSKELPQNEQARRQEAFIAYVKSYVLVHEVKDPETGNMLRVTMSQQEIKVLQKEIEEDVQMPSDPKLTFPEIKIKTLSEYMEEFHHYFREMLNMEKVEKELFYFKGLDEKQASMKARHMALAHFHQKVSSHGITQHLRVILLKQYFLLQPNLKEEPEQEEEEQPVVQPELKTQPEQQVAALQKTPEKQDRGEKVEKEKEQAEPEVIEYDLPTIDKRIDTYMEAKERALEKAREEAGEAATINGESITKEAHTLPQPVTLKSGLIRLRFDERIKDDGSLRLINHTLYHAGEMTEEEANIKIAKLITEEYPAVKPTLKRKQTSGEADARHISFVLEDTIFQATR